MTQSSYHHGDLRNALVDAGAALLESEGLAGVSLRSVARAAGVSHAAPYHHFTDKAALVEAIAGHGFERLSVEMTEALATAEDPLEQFRQTGVAYGRFALRHEALFRLMNRSELRRGASVAEAAHASYVVVEDAVRRCQESGAMVGDDPAPFARTAWAAVHGAILLHLDGLVDGDDTLTAERLVDEVTVILGLGFVPR